MTFTGDYLKRYTAQEKASALLLGSDDAERLSIFAALFGQLAPHVEAGWRLHDRLPYQSGWARKPFRAPQHPRRADAARVAWLQSLLHCVRPYQDQTLPWLAGWASYIGGYQADALGILLAAAIDQRDAVGEEVFDILLATARGEHEIGAMGRHVTRALLAASRPDGWESSKNCCWPPSARRASVRPFWSRWTRPTRRRSAGCCGHPGKRPDPFQRDHPRREHVVRLGWDTMNAGFATMELGQIEASLDDPKAQGRGHRRWRPADGLSRPLGGGLRGRHRQQSSKHSPCLRTRTRPAGTSAAHLLLQNEFPRSERRPRARAGQPGFARCPPRPARRLSG